jgi:hypothetical protein
MALEDSLGNLVSMCALHELDENLPSVQAFTTFGGYAVCEFHFPILSNLISTNYKDSVIILLAQKGQLSPLVWSEYK